MLLGACGGGGGSNHNSNGSDNSVPPLTHLIGGSVAGLRTNGLTLSNGTDSLSVNCKSGSCWATPTHGIAEVPVGSGFPNNLAVNTLTNKVYVPNYYDGTVTVIDGATNSSSTVTVGSHPLSLAVNASTNKIYATNSVSNDVTVIDGVTNTTTTIPVGASPEGIAVNAITNRIYVTNVGDDTVTVIDGATNSTATVTAGSGPQALAINAVTDKIYVANTLSNNITVIDGKTSTTTTVAAWVHPYAVAVNALTNKIYVTNAGSNNVMVIDGATNSTIVVPTGSSPEPIAVNETTNKIYVADTLSNNITVIDGTTNSATTIPVGVWPQYIAVNAATDKVYVANRAGATVGVDAQMTVIDGPTSMTATMSVSFPWAIAVNATTNKVYVANMGRNKVTVVDGVGAGGFGTYATPLIPADVPFTFANPVAAGASYNVLASNPAGQTCNVTSGGSGTMADSPISNIAVTCHDNYIVIGGSITGLASSALRLTNGTETISVPLGANGFTFPSPIAWAGVYDVRVGVQPNAQTCSVTNGGGTANSANLSISVSCQ